MARPYSAPFLILIISMMSYCDNKNNSWSKGFPRIHFIIHQDKVTLRVEQNIGNSIRHYKGNISFALTLLEKKFVPDNTELAWLFFQTFLRFS